MKTNLAKLKKLSKVRRESSFCHRKGKFINGSDLIFLSMRNQRFTVLFFWGQMTHRVKHLVCHVYTFFLSSFREGVGVVGWGWGTSWFNSLPSHHSLHENLSLKQLFVWSINFLHFSSHGTLATMVFTSPQICCHHGLPPICLSIQEWSALCLSEQSSGSGTPAQLAPHNLFTSL